MRGNACLRILSNDGLDSELFGGGLAKVRPADKFGCFLHSPIEVELGFVSKYPPGLFDPDMTVT